MGTTSCKLRIENKTKIDIVNTEAWGMDNYDWDDSQRPDIVFRGAFIKSNSSLTKSLEMTSVASNCPFTMNFTFRDGSEDCFRVNMKYVNNKAAAHFQRIQEEHLITYQRESDNTLAVIIKHTMWQIHEITANDLVKEAERLANRGKYKESLQKLFEALNHGREGRTKEQIQNRISEIQKKIGDQEMNNNAEDLIKAANDLIKKKLYEAALLQLVKAGSLATNQLTKKTITDLRAKVKNLQGLDNFEKAIIAENDKTADRSKDALEYLRKARALFLEANGISPNWDFRNNLASVFNKMQGNNLFNKANNLEMDAFNDFLQKNFKDSKEKYVSALDNYDRAKAKFETYDTWKQSVLITQNAINQLQEALGGVELRAALSDVVIVEDDKSDLSQHDVSITFGFEIGIPTPEGD